MAQSNEGNKEPMNMPIKGAAKNDSISNPGSVKKASAIFKGPKQLYQEVMNPDKKAGKFPG